MKLAIIGCGYWGRNYVRVLSELEDSNLLYVCDKDESKLSEVSRIFKVRTTIDPNEIFKDNEVQAVIIATDTSTHFELAKQCLNHEKHVLVEKPLTHSLKTSEELVNLAKEKNKSLMVGHTFLYNNAIKKLKGYIDTKEVGDVLYLTARRNNLGPIRTDVSALHDLATHDISVFLYLLNSLPKYVIANGGSFIQKEKDIEDFVNIFLEFENGVKATIEASWLSPKKVREITLVGSQKMIIFDDIAQDKITIFSKGAEAAKTVDYTGLEYKDYSIRLMEGDILLPNLKIPEPLKEQVLHFIKSIKNNSEPITNGQNAIDVLKVLEATQKSLKNNGEKVEIV
ncbi:MAG: Gfo/Idh/MocA family oxidoreductase [Nanoarchaeota archaeon]